MSTSLVVQEHMDSTMVSKFDQFCKNLDMEKVRFIIEELDIAPSYNNNELLVGAMKEQNHSIVKFLMSFEDVQNSIKSADFPVELIETYQNKLRHMYHQMPGFAVSSVQITDANKLTIMEYLGEMSNRIVLTK